MHGQHGQKPNQNQDECQTERTQTQGESYQKADGSYDLDKAFQELVRRVTKTGNEVPCSQEEFEEACQETGKIDTASIREAIAGFQAQAEGIIPGRIERDQIAEASGERGPDFVHKDEETGSTTVVHLKGPVGSAIQQAQGQNPNLERQGKAIGKGLFKQFAESINRDPSKVTVPSSITHNILIVDLCDLPTGEKSQMIRHIDKGLMDAYTDWIKMNDPVPLLKINYLN